MIKANPRFLKSRQKNSFRRFFVSNKMLTPKLGPGTYQLFLPPGMRRACTHIQLYIQLKSGKIYRGYRFFNFLKAFLSCNRDKYFALYWCFCVRISFILLLIKWSEMDPNVKPQTLVETFDQANYNSIPEYNVALITLLTYPVSICTA